MLSSTFHVSRGFLTQRSNEQEQLSINEIMEDECTQYIHMGSVTPLYPMFV